MAIDYKSIIENEPEADKMRSEIAAGIGQAQNTADDAVDTANEAKSTADNANNRVNNIISGQIVGKDQEVLDAHYSNTTGQTAPNIGARMDGIDSQLADKASNDYVNTLMSNITDGSPKELFYSLNALNVKYPTGAVGPMLVFDSSHMDGAHSYMWDGTTTQWIDMGLYQGLKIADGEVKLKSINSEVKDSNDNRYEIKSKTVAGTTIIVEDALNTEIKSTNVALVIRNKNLHCPSNIEIGAINLSGLPVADTGRCRTKDYVRVTTNQIALYGTRPEVIYCYDINKSYLGTSIAYTTLTGGGIYTLQPNTAFVKYRMLIDLTNTFDNWQNGQIMIVQGNVQDINFLTGQIKTLSPYVLFSGYNFIYNEDNNNINISYIISKYNDFVKVDNNGHITSNKFGEDTISIEATKLITKNLIIKSPNLFDVSIAALGKYLGGTASTINTIALTDNATYNTSAVMEVTENDILYFSNCGTAVSARTVIPFDSNGNQVANLSNLLSYIVPAGVKYIVFSYLATYAKFQVQKNAITKYYEYNEYYINVKKLNGDKISSDLIPIYIPTINLFDKYVLTAGREFNFYNTSIICDDGNSKYIINWDYTGAGGKALNKCFRINEATPGTYTLTIKLQKIAGYNIVDIATKSTQIVVIGKQVSSNITGLYIGDSYTNIGYIPKGVKDYFGSKLTLIGTKKTSIDGVDYNHEGRGGWSSYDYMQPSREGITNPFYNPEIHNFDFAYYMSQNYQGQHIDFVNILLGQNDAYVQDNLIYFETMISSIKSYDNNIKVMILTPTILPTDRYYFSGIDILRYRGMNWIQWEYDLFANREAEGVYFVMCYPNLNIDTDWGHITVAESFRNPTLIDVIADSIHPNNYGMLKISDGSINMINNVFGV